MFRVVCSSAYLDVLLHSPRQTLDSRLSDDGTNNERRYPLPLLILIRVHGTDMQHLTQHKKEHMNMKEKTIRSTDTILKKLKQKK
jgi:hypothetical protein